MEIFEPVRPRSDFHSDFVGSLPVGCKLPLFRVLLVSPEDEITYFEFSPYDLLAVASGYFFVLVLFLARQLHSWLHRQIRALHLDLPLSQEVSVGVGSPSEFSYLNGYDRLCPVRESKRWLISSGVGSSSVGLEDRVQLFSPFSFGCVQPSSYSS